MATRFQKEPHIDAVVYSIQGKNESSVWQLLGTGMEKTLSANLASRVIDSKVILIVCPNDVVEQWKNVIRVDQWNNTVYLLKESRYVRLADTMLRVLKHAKFTVPS